MRCRACVLLIVPNRHRANKSAVQGLGRARSDAKIILSLQDQSEECVLFRPRTFLFPLFSLFFFSVFSSPRCLCFSHRLVSRRSLAVGVTGTGMDGTCRLASIGKRGLVDSPSSPSRCDSRQNEKEKSTTPLQRGKDPGATTRSIIRWIGAENFVSFPPPPTTLQACPTVH